MNMRVLTGDVVGSLVKRRLQSQKYNQFMIETLKRICLQVDHTGSKILKGLRLLETLFDYRSRAIIADALYINDPSLLNKAEAKTSLNATIHEIFGDGVIDWNRIALVCAIVSLLAGEALRIGNISFVLHYIQWTEEYFRKKLIDAWIDRKCGWNEIYVFALKRKCEVDRIFGVGRPMIVRRKSTPPSARESQYPPPPTNVSEVASEMKKLADDVEYEAANCKQDPPTSEARPRARSQRGSPPPQGATSKLSENRAGDKAYNASRSKEYQEEMLDYISKPSGKSYAGASGVYGSDNRSGYYAPSPWPESAVHGGNGSPGSHNPSVLDSPLSRYPQPTGTDKAETFRSLKKQMDNSDGTKICFSK